MMYGYARVSTKEQNERRQLVALKDAGVEETSIFVDKQTGRDFNRSNYKKMTNKLKEGDVLVIKSIDRLGEYSGLHDTAVREKGNRDSGN